MNKISVKDLVIQTINDNLKLNISYDVLNTNIPDLEIDSLEFFQIIIDIEDKLDIEFREAIYEINTINDLINLVDETLKEKC